MRLLREYVSTAQVSHFCSCCMKYIEPGEQYRAQVYVTIQNKILVDKQHENPSCDFPDSEEEFGVGLEGKVLNFSEETSSLGESLKEAA